MRIGGILCARRVLAFGVVCGLFASACSASTTVPSAVGGEPVATARPSSIPEVEPTAEPANGGSDSQPTAPPETPTEAATPPTSPADFRSDSILGISNSGDHAYAGTSSPWNTETPCDAEVREALAVADVQQALDTGQLEATGAGLLQAGDVRQMIFGEGTRVAFLSSCGTFESPTLWLQRADLDESGRVLALGNLLPLDVPWNEGEPLLLQWIDFDIVEARVLVEVDPNDSNTWVFERRSISTVTGDIVSTEQQPLSDETALVSNQSYTSAGGRFTYRQIPDPRGSFGCEGFGVAAAIEVDDGTTRQLALGENGLVFSSVDNMHFDGNGFVAWTSGCEGFTSAYVGKVRDDGTIVDAHLIDTFDATGNNSFADYLFYRLTNDGHLAAVGLRFDGDAGEQEPVVWRYDLSTDPFFVNSASPPVQFDANPLAVALDGVSTWHVGETLGSEPACGGATLYANTDNGLIRALPGAVEIDAIVDLDVSEPLRVEFDDGTDYVTRLFVLQVECPGSYEGRQVWFTSEPELPRWGLSLERADLGLVADVLSVRQSINDNGFSEADFAEVVLLDGTVAEIELVAVPFDS